MYALYLARRSYQKIGRASSSRIIRQGRLLVARITNLLAQNLK